jgi:hypothetical protein
VAEDHSTPRAAETEGRAAKAPETPSTPEPVVAGASWDDAGGAGDAGRADDADDAGASEAAVQVAQPVADEPLPPLAAEEPVALPEPQPVPAPAVKPQPVVETIRVRVETPEALHRTGERSAGTNFCSLWNSTGASPGTVEAFAQTNFSLLRVPGGVPCQWYDWEFPLASGWTKITPDDAYRLAAASGAAMILQTNVARSDPKNKFDCSGAHAANWNKATRNAKIPVAFWEIGNEPECDAPDEIKNDQNRVYEWYNKMFEEHARAIKQVDRNARVMGPASANTWFWWAQANLEKFLAAHGNRTGTGLVDAVSVHWYPEGHKGSWEQKRGTAQGWGKCMEVLRAAIRKHDTRDLPLYVTEWNWGGGQDNTSAAELRDALGCADVIGMFLNTGVAGQTHFCLQKTEKGWGILGMADDPLGENGASPAYYALSMASMLHGEVLRVECAADAQNVLSAYAAREKTGACSVMLINKAGAPLKVALSFGDAIAAGATVDAYELRGAGGTVYDRDVIYNGVRSPQPARGALPAPLAIAWASDTTVDVPPYALVVARVPPR